MLLKSISDGRPLSESERGLKLQGSFLSPLSHFIVQFSKVRSFQINNSCSFMIEVKAGGAAELLCFFQSNARAATGTF